jgi:hypothetical protein
MAAGIRMKRFQPMRQEVEWHSRLMPPEATPRALPLQGTSTCPDGVKAPTLKLPRARSEAHAGGGCKESACLEGRVLALRGGLHAVCALLDGSSMRGRGPQTLWGKGFGP